VDVQSITEANLRISSGSGAVKLGKMKASSVDIDTAGALCLFSQEIPLKLGQSDSPP